MPKTFLENKNVSLRAKGLYALILAQPIHWENSIADLVEATGVSKHVIALTLQELEEKGYLVRHQMTEGGRFCGMEYELKEG